MKLEPSQWSSALLIALAAGSTALLVLTDDQPGRASLEARANNLLPSFAVDQLQSLAVEVSKERFVITAEPTAVDGEKRYMIRAEQLYPADSQAVLELLRALELAGFVRRLEAASEDRRSLGLVEPRGRLTLNFAGGEIELRIGKEARTPRGTSYLEVQTDAGAIQTFLVRTEFVREVLIGSADLRIAKLSPFAISEISKIRWRGGTQQVELRREKGPDFLDARGERAERAVVERLGLELARTRSKKFIRLDSARRAIASDQTALDVEVLPFGSEPSLRFRVGGTCPEDPRLEVLERVQPSPSGECVGPELRQSFHETAASMRDQTPFALRTDEVETLRIEQGEKVLELVRSEAGFRLLLPSRGEVELELGNARLDQLTQLRGERIEAPDLERLGLKPPSGRVTLRSSVIEQVDRYQETVEFGRVQPDGRLPIHRQRDGVTLLLGPEAPARFAVDSLLLRSRRLFSFAPSDLSSLTITTQGERQRLIRSNDGFELVEPRGQSHDGPLVLDLVQTLGTLVVDRWASEVVQPVHGLSRPEAEIELALRQSGSEPKRVKLTIGANTSTGAFGATDEQPGVFEVPRSFVSQVTTLLLSRAVFLFDLDQTSTISIESGGSTKTLRRTGDSFGEVGSGTRSAAVARLVHTISSLRPEAAVHTGGARPGEGFEAPRLVIRVVPLSPSRAPRIIRIGSKQRWRDEPVFFARVDGVDATYVLPEEPVRRILEDLGLSR